MSLVHYPQSKDLQVLVSVVKNQSFNGAAETLGQTPAFVSKRIQQLESALGSKLLERSSRGITLTESGKVVYEHAVTILEHLQTLVDDVTHLRELPVGMVNIGCSFGFGRNIIAPAITELMTEYPALQINFELFDRQIDLNKDDIDLDIRINDDIPENYIARLLMQNRRILCAAPQYLQQYGEPASLAELAHHDCLITKERDVTPGIWELEGIAGKKSVKVSGHLSSNSGEIILRWALEGKGIMLRSEWDTKPLLRTGQLVQILPEYTQSANVWAVYQAPLYTSVKLRVCVEFLTRYCRLHYEKL